jgi:hypothetical protein
VGVRLSDQHAILDRPSVYKPRLSKLLANRSVLEQLDGR